MKSILSLVAALSLGTALPAAAEYSMVQDKASFVKLVGGKTLTRPLVKLRVASNGRISGKGATWDVSGSWKWKNGYFCRTLAWGGDDLGYNCQQVKASGNKIRFTSDRGAGDSAEFRLR